MTERSTTPSDVEYGLGSSIVWQRNENNWSFGPTQHSVVGGHLAEDSIQSSERDNSASGLTRAPQEIKSPEFRPVVVEGWQFGKRGLQAVFEWEGVVESVNDAGFTSRIVPLAYGVPDRSKLELTEFTFDDLATEGDYPLVVPGAVFYWTVGRSRNPAGTITNLSLVRIRRLAATTPAQVSAAEAEADEILRVLGGKDGADEAERK
jgi:hypothetical protein